MSLCIVSLSKYLLMIESSANFCSTCGKKSKYECSIEMIFDNQFGVLFNQPKFEVARIIGIQLKKQLVEFRLSTQF